MKCGRRTLAACLGLVLGMTICSSPLATEPSWYYELAAHWAPNIFQDVRVEPNPVPGICSGNPTGRYDFITSATFDGDSSAANNWEHADDNQASNYPLIPYVYYSVIETRSHYYITYSLFHPRDWCAGWPNIQNEDDAELPQFEHENDLESATFVIKKDASEYGNLRLVYTIYHRTTKVYTNGSDIDPVDGYAGGHDVLFYQGKPCLFVQAEGHGIGDATDALEFSNDNSFPYYFPDYPDSSARYARFRDGDGIRYVYNPGNFEEPELCTGNGDCTAGYELLPFESTLWGLRYNSDGTLMFEDSCVLLSGWSCSIENAPEHFAAEDQPIRANPPWAYDQGPYGNEFRGLWFLMPATEADVLLDEWPDVWDGGYYEYVYNPYALWDSLIVLTTPEGGEGWQVGEVVSATWRLTEGQFDDHLGSTYFLWLSRDGGKTWGSEPVAVGPLADGACEWTVTGPPSNTCYLKLECSVSWCALVVTAIGGPYFIGDLRVVVPNGGEQWVLGGVGTIQWEVENPVPITRTDIYLSLDGGITYPHLIASLGGEGNEYVWNIPADEALLRTQARVKVIVWDENNDVFEDESDGNFTIGFPDADQLEISVVPNPGFLEQEHVVSVRLTAEGLPVADERIYFTTEPDGAGMWIGGTCGGRCVTTDENGEAEIRFYPNTYGDILLRATSEGGVIGETVLTVAEPTIDVVLFVRMLDYGEISRYMLTARLTDNGSPLPEYLVTLRTTNGYFEESGLDSCVTQTGPSGEAYGVIRVGSGDWGPVTLCCKPESEPEHCIDSYFSPWPPPPLAPFDTLDWHINHSVDDYDNSSGLEWSPDGHTITAGIGTGVHSMRYPEMVETMVFENPNPYDIIIDLSYSGDGSVVVAVDDDGHVLRIDSQNGSLLSQCYPGDNTFTVDLVSNTTPVVGLIANPGLWSSHGGSLVWRVNSATCTSTLNFAQFPPSGEQDVVRVRRHPNGRIAAVCSDGAGMEGSLAVFSGSGQRLRLWQGEGIDNFFDCDWFPDGRRVVASMQYYAAIYDVETGGKVDLAGVDEWAPAVASVGSDSAAVAFNNKFTLFAGTGEILASWTGPLGSRVIDLAYNPVWKVLLAAVKDFAILFFNLSNDHTPPLLAVPGEQVVPAGSDVVEVEGTVTDQTWDYLSVTAAIDGGDPVPLAFDDDGYFALDVELQSDTTLVVFVARDYYQQQVRDTTVVIRLSIVDQDPPEISQFVVDPEAGEPGAVFQFSVRVEDTGAGVDTSSVMLTLRHPPDVVAAELRMYDDGVHGGDSVAGDDVFSAEWNSQGAEAGQYVCDVSATDLADPPNAAVAESIGVVTVLDVIPPVVEECEVTPPEGPCGQVFSFLVRVTDVGAGVDTSSVWLHVKDPNAVLLDSLRAYDDGLHGGDQAAGDSVYSGEWVGHGQVGQYWIDVVACDLADNCVRAADAESLQISSECQVDFDLVRVMIHEDEVQQGSVVTIGTFVENHGWVESDSFTVAAVLVSVPSGEDTVSLGSERVGGLAPGGAGEYDLSFGVPGDAPSGLYRAWVVVDPEQAIPETDEGNNELLSDDGVLIGDTAGELAWILVDSGENSGAPPRELTSAVYDETNDRMVFFGGHHEGYKADTWAYSFSTGVWERADLGSGPGARHSIGAIYHTPTEAMIIHGGSTEGGSLSDTWRYDLVGGTWNRMDTQGEQARSAYGCIFDPIADRMVVFGGIRSGSFLNDVRALNDLSGSGPYSWETLHDGTGEGVPSPRAYVHAVYDPLTRRMLVFGGQLSGGGYANDLWAFSLDTAQWTILDNGASGAPEPRFRYFAGIDSTMRRLYVFGGKNAQSVFSDTWYWDLEAGGWTLVDDGTGGLDPGGRYQGVCVFRPIGNGEFVVYGGRRAPGGEMPVDMWKLMRVGTSSAPGDESPVATRLMITCMPNPTSGRGIIRIASPGEDEVSVTVYDVAGRLLEQVWSGRVRAGVTTIPWRGTARVRGGMPSGIYFLRVEGQGGVDVERLVVIR
jgi:hypothetical protein